jgi:predicted PurR-regulated permease PerM
LLDSNPSDPPFSKPGFATWLLMVAVALAAYFKFAAALFSALTLAVVCRPLYEVLLRFLIRSEFLKKRPALSQDMASVFTQLLACFFVFACVLAPLWVLTQNRKAILISAEDAYNHAREWSRGEVQSLGERLHIQEWNDFEDLPEPGDTPIAPTLGSSQEQPVQSKIVEMISHPDDFVSFALQTLGGGALFLGQMMFFFMAMHFLLLHGPGFWKDVLSRCPPNWSPTLASLSRRGRTVLMATCVVHGLSAVSAFLLALPVFFIIVGIKHFVLFAMLAGFFQFIPLLGSVTLVSLMTLYYFASGLVLEGWECVMIAVPLIVGVPDLIVRPYLAGRYGKVHSMTMLAGFITGFEVFGALGFILGPLFLDLIVQFTKQVLGERIRPPL